MPNSVVLVPVTTSSLASELMPVGAGAGAGLAEMETAARTAKRKDLLNIISSEDESADVLAGLAVNNRPYADWGGLFTVEA